MYGKEACTHTTHNAEDASDASVSSMLRRRRRSSTSRRIVGHKCCDGILEASKPAQEQIWNARYGKAILNLGAWLGHTKGVKVQGTLQNPRPTNYG